MAAKPSFFLYDDPAAEALEVTVLADYLRERFPQAEVTVRESFPDPAHGPDQDGLARVWAAAKVRDVQRPLEPRAPLYGEIAYERRRLAQGKAVFGVLYDGPTLQAAFREWLPPAERRLSAVHLLFTQQLIGTFDEDDRRYHARVIVAGFPALISVSGLVEAPARPRAYYLAQQQFAALGQSETGAALARAELAGRFLEHGDPRTTEALKGYALQAVFYQWTGEAFCEEVHCRLFNAHWQEELLQAQRGEGAELCPRHQRQLEAWAAGMGSDGVGE